MWLNVQFPAQALYEGMLYSDPKEVVTRFASAAIRAGLLVQRGAVANQVSPIAALPAAVANSILVGPATAVVAGQTIADVAGVPGGVLDGAIGPGRIWPPRAIRYTFNANANWGLAAQGGTWCRTNGLDSEGNEIESKWFLPAGGNIVIDTDRAFSKYIETYIGACDGAGGGATLTIGTSNARVELAGIDYGVAIYERARDPQQVAATAGLTTDTTFVANESLDVLYDGTIAVVNELTAGLAVAVGDPVGVRVVAAGANVRGQFTRWTSPDAGNFAHLRNAEWVSAAAAGGVALIRVWR